LDSREALGSPFGTFCPNKTFIPPFRCSVYSLIPFPHSQPYFSASQSFILTFSFSLGHPLGGGSGWGIGLRTNLGNGDNGRAEEPWQRLHSNPPPHTTSSRIPDILSLLISSTGPGQLSWMLHCKRQLVPWGWVGEAGREWGAWAQGWRWGVGKKLGWAPGTSWAMSRGSSREAK
jgi:hypothetical protein